MTAHMGAEDFSQLMNALTDDSDLGAQQHDANAGFWYFGPSVAPTLQPAAIQPGPTLPPSPSSSGGLDSPEEKDKLFFIMPADSEDKEPTLRTKRQAQHFEPYPSQRTAPAAEKRKRRSHSSDSSEAPPPSISKQPRVSIVGGMAVSDRGETVDQQTLIAAVKNTKKRPANVGDVEDLDEKQMIRMLRNRAAAQESRDRKKRYQRDLEVTNQSLVTENKQLQERVQGLEAQNRFFLGKLAEFEGVLTFLKEKMAETNLGELFFGNGANPSALPTLPSSDVDLAPLFQPIPTITPTTLQAVSTRGKSPLSPLSPVSSTSPGASFLIPAYNQPLLFSHSFGIPVPSTEALVLAGALAAAAYAVVRHRVGVIQARNGWQPIRTARAAARPAASASRAVLLNLGLLAAAMVRPGRGFALMARAAQQRATAVADAAKTVIRRRNSITGGANLPTGASPMSVVGRVAETARAPVSQRQAGAAGWGTGRERTMLFGRAWWSGAAVAEKLGVRLGERSGAVLGRDGNAWKGLSGVGSFGRGLSADLSRLSNDWALGSLGGSVRFALAPVR